MLQTSPEIDLIIEAATQYAANKNHEYVTLEHLTYAMVTNESFKTMLETFGCDVTALAQDIDQYVDKQSFLISKGYDIVPKKTHSLERVFNRAFTQVLFSGRQNLQVIDLFLSLTSEDKSHARYFLVKYGLERGKIVTFWNKNYAETKTQKKSKSGIATPKTDIDLIKARLQAAKEHFEHWHSHSGALK